MAVAKRRAIDLIRRKETFARKLAELGHELEIVGERAAPDPGAAPGDDIEDDLLRLVFISPVTRSSRPGRGSRSRSACSAA
jgi:predicted RNA polymerase sigma factor